LRYDTDTAIRVRVSRAPAAGGGVVAESQFHPPWFDPRMPRREDCVLKALLDDRAARIPERRVALFEDGTEWTWAGCRAQVRAQAAALQALGVRAGDRVIGWLPNGPALVRTWFAANYLGAVFVPLNTAYRGATLAHVVNACRARVLLAHASLVERLEGLEFEHLERVVAVGSRSGEAAPVSHAGSAAPEAATPAESAAPAARRWRLEPESALEGDGVRLDDSFEPQPWDVQTIIYTSGTTGLSKGVLSPYLQLYTTATVVYGYLRQGEGILVNLPMFHVGGTSSVAIALIRSGSFHLVDGFSTDRFWDQVRRGNCATTSGLIGIMGAFLMRSPPRPEDRTHSIHCLTGFPVNEQTVKIRERFGIDYLTGFNMTELSAPLVSELNSDVFGASGKPRSGVECRLVDANDIEVPDGEPGELIVRSDLPWTFNAGYDGLPAETARAWRNGWFHTGDILRKGPDGSYFFVDRLKDSIRRRGENISSMEVEAAVRAFPGVEEVIAVGIPVESEEEVMAVIVPAKGATLDPAALIEFLVPRLPYFAVPRFVRVVDSIPKTETNKQRKFPFRDAGVTPDTWDRVAAGIVLKRERLG
jgi:crotonobetaine/carnitine-CoA ligase